MTMALSPVFANKELFRLDNEPPRVTRNSGANPGAEAIITAGLY